MLLLVTAALAAAPAEAPAATFDRLHARVEAELSFAHAAAHAAGDDEGELPGACLTSTVAELKLHWDEFTPAQRAELTRLLAPGKADLFEPLTRADAAPPPPDATNSCFGQQKANRLLGSRFVVEWDSGIDSDTAQDFLDALEYAYDVEIDQLGWRAPAGADRYLLPAYVERGNYAGAYTTVGTCGGDYLPYIVAYAGSFSSGNWYETMALHEFNHALQFNYSFAPEFFWWEATATYIEEQVLPNSNWWSTYVVGYSQNPQLAMSAYSQSDQDVFYHMYGMSIWGFYLDEYQGGPDIVRQTWEAAVDERGQYNFSMEEMLDELGIDFLGAYTDFTARNAAMEYREHRYYTSVDTVDSVSKLPADGGSSSRTAPAGYGQNYIKFKASAGDGEKTLTVHFHGDSGADWLAQLVEVNNTSVLRTAVGTVNAGEATIELEAFGDQDVYLVVSPLQNNDRTKDYTWEAELTEPPPTDTGDSGAENGGDTGADNGGDTGDDGDTDGEVTKFSLAGCGCATGGNPAQGAVALLGLAGLVALRRRR